MVLSAFEFSSTLLLPSRLSRLDSSEAVRAWTDDFASLSDRHSPATTASLSVLVIAGPPSGMEGTRPGLSASCRPVGLPVLSCRSVWGTQRACVASPARHLTAVFPFPSDTASVHLDGPIRHVLGWQGSKTTSVWTSHIVTSCVVRACNLWVGASGSATPGTQGVRPMPRPPITDLLFWRPPVFPSPSPGAPPHLLEVLKALDLLVTCKCLAATLLPSSVWRLQPSTSALTGVIGDPRRNSPGVASAQRSVFDAGTPRSNCLHAGRHHIGVSRRRASWDEPRDCQRVCGVCGRLVAVTRVVPGSSFWLSMPSPSVGPDVIFRIPVASAAACALLSTGGEGSSSTNSTRSSLASPSPCRRCLQPQPTAPVL